MPSSTPRELRHAIPTQQPEWFRLMPANGYLNRKEVAEVTGYKPTSVDRMSQLGYLPSPHAIKRQVINSHPNGAWNHLSRWRAGDIRKWLEEKKAAHA